MLQGGKIMQAIIENYNWLPYGYFEAGVPAGNDTKVLKIGIVSGVSVFFLWSSLSLAISLVASPSPNSRIKHRKARQSLLNQLSRLP